MSASVSRKKRSLRPFFSFYGGKWRDSPRLYPSPTHDLIVEPFAGSAGYSLRHYSNDVLLCEADPVVAEVWRFIIAATSKEILRLPDLPDDGTVDDLPIPQEAKWLIGFWLNRGAPRPRKSPSRWMRSGIRPGCFWGPSVRKRIASQLKYIRHWRIINAPYNALDVEEPATWFVDPPYQHSGHHYAYGSEQIDYRQLSDWCQSRAGQVIVCEKEGADWLPFEFLADTKTTRRTKRSREVVWLSAYAEATTT